MIYKFKDDQHNTSMEVEAVREKLQITVCGENEDLGIDLDLEETEKLIEALNTIRQQMLQYKKRVETENI